MKRTLAILMLLTLLLSAHAEEADFLFREGIQWGMSQEDVLKAEGNPKYERDVDDGIPKIEIDDVDQDGVQCDIEYAFVDDALFMATFEYDTEDVSVSYDDLLAVLTRRYGEPGAFSDDVKALLSQDDLAELDAISSWALEDGTHIWLMNDADDRSIEIMFVELGW